MNFVQTGSLATLRKKMPGMQGKFKWNLNFTLDAGIVLPCCEFPVGFLCAKGELKIGKGFWESFC